MINATSIAGVSATVAGGDIVSADGVPHASILLRILATLVRPEAGQLTIGGIDAVARPLEARRLIAYASPDIPLPEGLTVGEYLSFIVAARRQPREGAAAAAARFGLDTRRLLRKLNPADRQRARLAACAVSGSRAVILDRACAALDESGCQAVAEWLLELQGHGAAIVLTGAESLASISARPLLPSEQAVA